MKKGREAEEVLIHTLSAGLPVMLLTTDCAPATAEST